MTPIIGIPSIFLLSKAASDVSWIWHQRLSHLNFKNINKLVFKYLVCDLPILKFDNNHLYALCEHGKQHLKENPLTIDTYIVEPLELLHIVLMWTFDN